MEDAYLAGLFDGTGTLGIYSVSNGRSGGVPKVYWSCRLVITNSYRPTLLQIKENYPGASLIELENGKTFRLQITRKSLIKTLLTKIRPHLQKKSVEVGIVMSWIDGELDGALAAEQCKAAKQYTELRNRASNG